jgi:hypothetical protein
VHRTPLLRNTIDRNALAHKPPREASARSGRREPANNLANRTRHIFDIHAGSARPIVSTLNSWDGTVAANAAIVPAGANGAIDVYVTNPTHVILDINGYFAP